MSQTESPNGIPFVIPEKDHILGISKRRRVSQIGHLAVKMYRPESIKVFPTFEHAIANILAVKAKRQEIMAALCESSHGVELAEDLLPETFGVIHKLDDHLTISWVQQAFPDSTTLAESGTDIFKLNSDSLSRLRVIFAANIDHFRKTGKSFDIVGSHTSLLSTLNVARHLFPIFTSRNISLNNLVPYYLDIGVSRLQQEGVLHQLRRRCQIVGSHLSISLIDSLLAIKNLQK